MMAKRILRRSLKKSQEKTKNKGFIEGKKPENVGFYLDKSRKNKYKYM